MEPKSKKISFAEIMRNEIEIGLLYLSNPWTLTTGLYQNPIKIPGGFYVRNKKGGIKLRKNAGGIKFTCLEHGDHWANFIYLRMKGEIIIVHPTIPHSPSGINLDCPGACLEVDQLPLVGQIPM